MDCMRSYKICRKEKTANRSRRLNYDSQENSQKYEGKEYGITFKETFDVNRL